MITVKNITGKGAEKNWNGNIYHADIEPKQSLRLYGWIQNAQTPHEFELAFKVGDHAEYDSYNLAYVGTIESIGEKTVTIRERGGRLHRLSLYEFAWRNHNFDLARIQDSNDRESLCI